MGGVQIGSLHVSLSADSAVFEKGMDNAVKKADDSFEKVVAGAKAMAGMLAAAVSIDFMADAIKRQIDYADSLADVAARTFQTTEQLSAMEYALHFSDASLEGYTAGLQKLSVNMAAAGDGAKAQAEMFSRLGISIYEQDGRLRDAGDVMLDFSDKLAGMENGAAKTAIVMDVLGKSAGPELLPFLNQGSQGIRDLTSEAERLGLVISKEASAQAGILNDNLDKMRFMAQGAARQFGAGLTPALVDVTSHMLKASDNADKFASAGRAMGQVVGAIYYGLSGLSIMAGKVADGFGKLLALDEAMLRMDWDQFKNIWNDNSAKDKAIKDLQDLQDWYKKFQENPPTIQPLAPPPESAPPPPAKQTGKAATDNFQYGGLSLSATEYNNATTAESLSAQQYLANQQQELEAFSASIDEMLVEQDAASVIADQQWSDLVDGEIQRMDEMNAYKLEAHRGLLAGLLTLDQKRVSDVVTMGDAELEERKRQMAATVDFFQQGLASMAQGQGKAAKAARNIQRAEALYQIGVNTYSAAMGAYNALAPIPFVGPALGVAAAGAAIAFGANMAQGVMGGGTPTITGGAPTALPATRDVLSQSEQRQQSEKESGGVTYFRVPEDAILTGRTLIDLIDNAFANGKKPNNIRFIPA